MQVKTYEEMFGKKLTVRDLIDGFYENTKTGMVESMGGLLDIRPPYQRSFVYERDRQESVIHTIMHGFPLNSMYWAKRDDGRFEMMDGQQRTISICKYANGEFSVSLDSAGKQVPKTFENLGPRKQDFLDYPLTIYICVGTEDEKLNWFRTINIMGVPLTDQEMRNAIYNGDWVTDAKRYFSRLDGLGYRSEGKNSNGKTYGDYMNVVGGAKSEKENSIVRQKLLEIVLIWATDAYNRENGLSGKDKLTVDDYMNKHRKEPNAKALWGYYEAVMEWVRRTFPVYREFMKGVEWGILYNIYGKSTPADAEARVEEMLKLADEISNLKGVFIAALSGDVKYINARTFDKRDMAKKYEEQKGVCPYCRNHFEASQMHGDHIRPWSKGGKTEYKNLQMLCTECNLKKSNHDVNYAPWDSSTYESFDISKWGGPGGK